MKKLFSIILILSLTLCGCSNEKEINKPKENVTVLTNKEMKKIMTEKEYVIIDVRSASEYNEGHIKGAINIPHTEIDETISLDKEKNIFVYCYSGGRSAIAKTLLENLGYKVYDLGALNTIDLPTE